MASNTWLMKYDEPKNNLVASLRRGVKNLGFT